MKITRLGLEVVVGAEKNERTTTTAVKLTLLGELPSIEEQLAIKPSEIRIICAIVTLFPKLVLLTILKFFGKFELKKVRLTRA